ncbi:hypothetical protein NBO_78g0014 [Nosema bombycis CQ1]|uniref:Uncharacterized protein n=1 Tax=Nosema bombycis (strain CQ1 / CVCC 102059) TaxID=578461 RepID=R0MKU7_NOSB1|nr:hypothetical protein NBO_78g0014 [Nosema bombycis CQ1]|eukprot:EOB13388.1 hypothetical protein NBO_78g0014 [Nosema bombycis CQ1]
MQLINIFSLTVFLFSNIATSAEIPNEHSAIESDYDFSDNQNEIISNFAVNPEIARSFLLLNDKARNIEKIINLYVKVKYNLEIKNQKSF